MYSAVGKMLRSLCAEFNAVGSRRVRRRYLGIVPGRRFSSPDALEERRLTNAWVVPALFMYVGTRKVRSRSESRLNLRLRKRNRNLQAS